MKPVPKKTSLVFLCILFSLATRSQFYHLTDTIAPDPGVIVGKLANGLTYYIRNNGDKVRNLQMRLVVNAGSVLEDPDQQGLAHFMEHMNFNGLKHFPKNELETYLQSNGLQMGADLNANTGYDATSYILWMVSGDNKKIDKGFTILEDWDNNALLDPQEIERERGVVLEESRLHKNAQDRMRNQYGAALLNGSVYAYRSPGGKDSIIESFTPESLKRFYETWYRPDLSAVIVVGNIDTSFVKKEITKHFSSYQNPVGETPRPSQMAFTPRKQDAGMVVTDNEAQQTSLTIFGPTQKKPVIATWGDLRQTLAERLLVLLVSDRLGAIVRDPASNMLTAGCSYSELVKGYRSFNYYITVGDKPVKDAIDKLEAAVQSIANFGFLPAELERAKSKLARAAEQAYLDRDKAPSGRFASEYSENFTNSLPIVSIEDNYLFGKENLKTITAAELQAMFNNIQSGEGKFVLVTAPEKNKDQLPGDRALLDLVAVAEKMPATPYTEKSIAADLMEKEPERGVLFTEASNKALGTTNLIFKNGVSVTLKPTDFKNDDLQMDAWRLGGSHNYGLEQKQNAANAARIVETMGVEHFLRPDLDKFLSGKTVTAHPYINAYEEGIEGKCSAKDLVTFLQLVHLYFTAPAKDEALFRSFITFQKGASRDLKTTPANYYSDSLTKTEYQHSPWANSIPVASDFDEINLDSSFAIYKKIYSNAYAMHFTFVGNIDIEKIKPLLELYLGSLPATSKEIKFTDEGMRPVKGIKELEVKKGQGKQAQVNLVFTGEAPFVKSESIKLDILCAIIQMKIMEKLREEMGGIYTASVSSALSKRPYEHYVIGIRFPCGPENTEKLTQAVYGIILEARNKGVDKKYLADVKEMMKKHHAGEMHTNEFWLQLLSRGWINQEDPEWANSFYNDIDNIDAHDMKETAQRYFNMDNFIRGVLKPE